jgi:hypothetical protein
MLKKRYFIRLIFLCSVFSMSAAAEENCSKAEKKSRAKKILRKALDAIERLAIGRLPEATFDQPPAPVLPASWTSDIQAAMSVPLSVSPERTVLEQRFAALDRAAADLQKNLEQQRQQQRLLEAAWQAATNPQVPSSATVIAAAASAQRRVVESNPNRPAGEAKTGGRPRHGK